MNPYGIERDKDWLKMADHLKAMGDDLPMFPYHTIGKTAEYSHFIALAAALRSAEALCRMLVKP